VASGVSDMQFTSRHRCDPGNPRRTVSPARSIAIWHELRFARSRSARARAASARCAPLGCLHAPVRKPSRGVPAAHVARPHGSRSGRRRGLNDHPKKSPACAGLIICVCVTR
jgi:hypothetical protein